MSVRVSGKHMEIGDSFRQKIEDQIGVAVTKYFDGGYSGQVIVEKSNSRFSADCKLHLDSGVVLHAAGEAMDPQIAFDAASERIEKRLRRYKRKLKDHHAGNHLNGFAEVAYTVMDAVPITKTRSRTISLRPSSLKAPSSSRRCLSQPPSWHST